MSAVLKPIDRDPAPALTAADHRLLQWLAAGRTNAQIGLCLHRSEKTVRNQLTRLYAHLGVANRAEAVAVYLRMVPSAHEPQAGSPLAHSSPERSGQMSRRKQPVLR